MSERNGAIDLGSLEPIQIEYTIGGNRFLLREASEGDAASWERQRINSRIFSEQGKVLGLKPEADDLGASLLSKCLWTETNPNDKASSMVRVSAEDISNWPARITAPLIAKAKEISGLDQADTVETLEKELKVITDRLAKLKEDSSKNSQSAGTPTSASAKS